MTAAGVAARLGARPTGPGRWLARCPAHDDRAPSLSIGEGSGGRVLLHCHAGCITADVLAAAGLAWRDVCGAPTSAANRARLLEEREQREAAEAARRQRQRTVAAAAAAQAHAGRLAARLAALEWGGIAPSHPGEAAVLAADFHAALDAAHALEAA